MVKYNKFRSYAGVRLHKTDDRRNKQPKEKVVIAQR